MANLINRMAGMETVKSYTLYEDCMVKLVWALSGSLVQSIYDKNRANLKQIATETI